MPSLFWAVSQGKKSLTLNLKSAEAAQIVEELVQKSDVLMEGFRPGTMDRLGLSYETVKTLNPRVIYCSISGFGQTRACLMDRRTSASLLLNGRDDMEVFGDGRKRRAHGQGVGANSTTSARKRPKRWSVEGSSGGHERDSLEGEDRAPWRDLPKRYGSWQTCYDRFVRWQQDGTWDRLLANAQTKSDAVGEVEWEVSVDDTVVRAHQHAASARTEPSKKGVEHPLDEALGKSCGGFSTKVHLACDGRGRPLSVVLTPGQRHCSTQLGAVLDGIRVRRWGVGRPRKRPDRLIADKGFDFPNCRRLLRKRGIPHTIPKRRHRRERRAQRPGRPPSFDAATYARRNERGRAVCQPAQAMAGDRHLLREASGQLPGRGVHRFADDLVGTMIRQTRPSRTVKETCVRG